MGSSGIQVRSTTFARLGLVAVVMVNSASYLILLDGSYLFNGPWYSGELGGKILLGFSLLGPIIVGLGSSWAQQLETFRQREASGKSKVPWRYSNPLQFALWITFAVIVLPTGLVIFLSDQVSQWWIILAVVQWDIVLIGIALLSPYERKT